MGFSMLKPSCFPVTFCELQDAIRQLHFLKLIKNTKTREKKKNPQHEPEG